jgi:hypothetical protein
MTRGMWIGMAGGATLFVSGALAGVSVSGANSPRPSREVPNVVARHNNHVADSVFVPINPHRVYDSRTSSSLFGGHSRTVSVATGTNGTANVVPAGATAITYTLTVTHTSGSGHLIIYPAGVSRPAVSTIYWSGSGQTIATGSTVRISNNRQITAYAAGTGRTDFIIDVTGYFTEQIWAVFDGGSDIKPATIITGSPHVLSVTRVSAGDYEVSVDRPVDDCSATATMIYSSNPDDAYTRAGEFGPNTVEVLAITASQTTDDSTISIVITC